MSGMATKRRADDSSPTDIKKKRYEDEQENQTREKFRFLLVGKTGSGKSSTGNTILGRPLFTTDVSFSSVTDDCQLHSAVRFGASIDVMDCPGLFDTHSSDEDVASAILETLSAMDPGPDVICYVMQVGRYTEEEFGAYRRLTAMLDDVTDHTIVVMTHGDSLKGQDVWQKLKDAPHSLQSVLKECGHRVTVFDNTLNHHQRSQVTRLLKEARKLKSLNEGRPYTLDLEDDVEEEAEARLLRVEKMETTRKALVRKLVRQKEEARQKLLRGRRTWEERSKELEEASRRTEKIMDNKKRELSRKLRDQRETNAWIEEEMERVREELEEQRRAYASF